MLYSLRSMSFQRGVFPSLWIPFGFRIRQNPMWQAAREPARYTGIRRQANRGP